MMIMANKQRTTEQYTRIAARIWPKVNAMVEGVKRNEPMDKINLLRFSIRWLIHCERILKSEDAEARIFAAGQVGKLFAASIDLIANGTIFTNAFAASLNDTDKRVGAAFLRELCAPGNIEKCGVQLFQLSSQSYEIRTLKVLREELVKAFENPETSEEGKTYAARVLLGIFMNRTTENDDELMKRVAADIEKIDVRYLGDYVTSLIMGINSQLDEWRSSQGSTTAKMDPDNERIVLTLAIFAGSKGIAAAIGPLTQLACDPILSKATRVDIATELRRLGVSVIIGNDKAPQA